MRAVTPCLLAACLPLAAATIDIGDRKQLFIDHKFIEASEGIRLRAHPARSTREKLLTTDAPWEGDARLGSYSTVIAESGKVRLWYQVLAGPMPPGQNPPFMGVAYAESTDGLRFTKPVLNLVERNGSKANNLVMPTDPALASLAGGTVLRDDNPNAPAGERYKSWSKLYGKPGSPIRGPHRVWYSPDGIHWKLYESRVTGLRAADTQPSWFWDPRVGRYVGYSREWVREKAGFGARMASYNESDDMLGWDSAHMALFPDDREVDLARAQVRGEDVLPQALDVTDQVLTPTSPVDIYGPGVFPYEGVYIAAMSMFHHWARVGTWPATGDVRLATSRDGRHFARPEPRDPLLRTGPDGSFDSKWVWMLPRPVVRGDELWIYYVGTNHDHSYRLDPAATKEETAVGRAVLRLDGFVSAAADHESGWMMTPPVQFAGTRLELNVDTGAGGSVRVEILEDSGKPIPGFTVFDADEINGDSVRRKVTWQGSGDVSRLAGRAMRLRFRMRAADVYAFQFK